MLLQNATNFASNPITLTGGTLAGEAVYLGLRDQTFLAFAGSVAQNAAVPVGYTPGDAWFPAIQAGGLGAGSQSDLSGTAILAAGRNAEATSAIELTSSADMVGVANMSAMASLALSSSANATSTSAMEATASTVLSSTANMAAAAAAAASASITLTASADITLAPSPMVASGSFSLSSTADAVGLANLAAASTSELSVLFSDLRANAFLVAAASSTFTGTASQGAQAFMTAASGGPEALSPQGLATAVWSAVDSANNIPGTMGAKVNAAASAGDPWSTLLPGSYTPGSAGHLMSLLALENPDIALQLSEVWMRLGLDSANPLVNTDTLISAGPTVQLDVVSNTSGTTLTRQ